ncbi:hypothetical protein FHS85_002907 [Rhodoligotrophos appendicifer]|uniref:hypothetical protein n=1 Tax=Rhodoligotrophos appendicifer TaxID=987056 RepID=UPI0011867474|nr:hypothetical protein [Rhodoligotrophos appendicifer]
MRPDLRRETDAWSLLVWAYKAECVRAGVGGDDGAMLGYSTSSVWSAAKLNSQGDHRSATINGWLPVHEDALSVHAWVKGLPRAEFWLIVNAAEQGEMPSRVVDLPPLQCRPIMRQTSAGLKPKMLRHPRTHQGYACLVEFVGYSVEQIAEEQGRVDARFESFCDVLLSLYQHFGEGEALTKWRVSQPWKGYREQLENAA